MKLPRLERSLQINALVLALVLLLGAAGAVTALESETVPSFWGGLWWSVSLMTNLGYVYGTPHTTTATFLSVVLMTSGFLLLSLLSATLAAIFIRSDGESGDRLTQDLEHQILERLADIADRVEALERRLPPPEE